MDRIDSIFNVFVTSAESSRISQLSAVYNVPAQDGEEGGGTWKTMPLRPMASEKNPKGGECGSTCWCRGYHRRLIPRRSRKKRKKSICGPFSRRMNGWTDSVSLPITVTFLFLFKKKKKGSHNPRWSPLHLKWIKTFPEKSTLVSEGFPMREKSLTTVFPPVMDRRQTFHPSRPYNPTLLTG